MYMIRAAAQVENLGNIMLRYGTKDDVMEISCYGTVPIR